MSPKIIMAMDDAQYGPNSGPFKAAKAQVASLGFKLDHDGSDYIVRYPGRSAADYFTDDLQDAIGTARYMATERDKKKK